MVLLPAETVLDWTLQEQFQQTSFICSLVFFRTSAMRSTVTFQRVENG